MSGMRQERKPLKRAGRFFNGQLIFVAAFTETFDYTIR